jgi:hypothetical protein
MSDSVNEEDFSSMEEKSEQTLSDIRNLQQIEQYINSKRFRTYDKHWKYL